MNEILNQIVGPYGALVLALIALVWVTRQWRAEVKTLRDKLEAAQNAHLADLMTLRAQLKQQGDQHLADTRQNTETLLMVQERTREAMQKVWQLLRNGTLRPPPR